VAQLKDLPKAQYTYLHVLSDYDPHAGKDFGTLQAQLTAEYFPERLMTLLRTSNYVPLNEALQICQSRQLIAEQVFVLQRMGMTSQALELIVTKLGASSSGEGGKALGEKHAVEKAIEFCKEVDDDDLWDDLIQRSLEKPEFILGLLNNTGAHINPQRLIKRIRPVMHAPHPLLPVPPTSFLVSTLAFASGPAFMQLCCALVRLQCRCASAGHTSAILKTHTSKC
jgi:hypothetical protein